VDLKPLPRWPIARTHVYELPREGTDERRTLLFAEIASPYGAIPFFVTHLNWKFDEGQGFPAILVGDT
jgi:endonuclease/exonuclease/phosphatase family metal-dependent hydrolase